jgi:hypothetical protein
VVDNVVRKGALADAKSADTAGSPGDARFIREWGRQTQVSADGAANR